MHSEQQQQHRTTNDREEPNELHTAEAKRQLSDAVKCELEIVKITEDLYDQTVELFKTALMKYENLSIACDLLSSQQSINEMERLIRAVLLDGISFAAFHCQTKELVAFCANKMLCPDADVCADLDAVFADFRSPGMTCIGSSLERLERAIDLFKEWNIDCMMEIYFLSTRQDFGGRGLATKLAKHSVDYARRILEGTLSEKERTMLPAHVQNLKPKAICSVFSSHYSQKVGKNLGMEAVVKIPTTDFSYEGKTFAEKLDPIHDHIEFAAMKL